MDSVIFFNGRPTKDTSLAELAGNRAFRYGDGLFETIRVYKGKPLFTSLHQRRLSSGLKTLGIKCEEVEDLSLFEKNLKNLSEANHIVGGGRIRFSVYRAPGGLYLPASDIGITLAEAQTLEQNIYKLNDSGSLLHIYKDIAKPLNILSGLKNPNALLSVLASKHKPNNTYESIIINENGHLCEGAYANLFVLKDNTLHTPALSEGCVDGIMRQIIIKLILKHTSITLKEGGLTEKLLIDAQEVFLCNAIQGIIWIKGFEKRRYYNDFARTLVKHLNSFAEFHIL